jgi:hypothetical protein
VYNPAYCNAVSYPGAATTGGTCSSPSGQPLMVYAYGTGSATVTSGGLINTTARALPAPALPATASRA